MIGDVFSICHQYQHECCEKNNTNKITQARVWHLYFARLWHLFKVVQMFKP